MSKVWRQEYLPGFTITRQENTITICSYGYSGERHTPERVSVSVDIRMSPEVARQLAPMVLSQAMMEQPDEDDES